MGLEAVSFINDLVITNPTAGDNRSEGDDHIRNVKTAVKACFPGLAGRAYRTQSKSSGYTAVATDNMSVIKCTATLTLDLTAAATLGNGWCCWVQVTGGTTTIDPNGAETINGGATYALAAGSYAFLFCDGTSFFLISEGMPTGTTMVFYQASPPVGWNTVAQNNKALRVVSSGGTGGTAGGSVAFTTAFTSQAVAGTNAAVAAPLPAHTHTFTTSNTGAHTHTPASPVTSFFGAQGGGGRAVAGSGNEDYVATTSSAGAHQHTGTTDSTGPGGTHTHTFTGTAINLAVQYCDVILASKA